MAFQREWEGPVEVGFFSPSFTSQYSSNSSQWPLTWEQENSVEIWMLHFKLQIINLKDIINHIFPSVIVYMYVSMYM